MYSPMFKNMQAVLFSSKVSFYENILQLHVLFLKSVNVSSMNNLKILKYYRNNMKVIYMSNVPGIKF